MVTFSSSVLLLSLLGNGIIQDSDLRSWNYFKEKYNKTYKSATEEYYRVTVFINNLQSIEEHNLQFEAGKVSWKMGITQFTDQTSSEFKSLNNCRPFKRTNIRVIDIGYFGHLNVTESEVNWNKAGYVTPVKYQGECGSCYAFSSTGAIEAQLYAKTKKLVGLSEQNLVDCTSGNKYGNYGCKGGYIDSCFQYVHDFGLMQETSYPYSGSQGVCRFTERDSLVKVKEYHSVAPSEEALQYVVANFGPVSVAVCANGFQNYNGGVLDYDCHEVNHDVLVVGYGEDQGNQYWLVKNSWGTGWGEKGYVRMARNKNNQAHIASFALIPFL